LSNFTRAKYCMYCGKELPIDVSFCSGCGRPSRPETPSAPLVATPVKAISVKQVSRRSRNVILVILLVSLVFNVILCSYVSNPTSMYDRSASYRELETKYNDLYHRYQILTQEYSSLSHEYDKLLDEYDKLKNIALLPPYSSISGGEIRWVFYNLRGDITTWKMPLDTYRHYVSMNKPVEMVNLKTAGGTVSAYDMRPYIQPSFFENVIVDLTYGRSDREFVKEVDSIKNQIVVYGRGIGVAPYQFPAETLTEGRGVCADSAILMASMLIEGNGQGNYRFKVYVWYVQVTDGSLVSDNESLTEANHAIIEVEFSDGERWAIETTTDYFFVYSQSYTGWRFDVTTINR